MVEVINQLKCGRKESQIFNKIEKKAKEIFEGFGFSINSGGLRSISISEPELSSLKVKISYDSMFLECHDRDLHIHAFRLAQYCEKISNKKFRLYTYYDL